MSLLNNALREAEQRQRRPEVTGAYTGAVQEGRSGQQWVVVLVFVLALGVVAAGLFWFLMNASPSPSEAEVSAATNAGDGQVKRAAAEAEVVVASEHSEAAPAIVLEATVPEAPVTEPEPEPAPKTLEVSKPQVQARQESVSESKSREVQAGLSPQSDTPVATTEPEPEPTPAPTPAVKTTPQSPGAIDRQAAKNLESLIAGGRMVEAERRLTNLSQSQAAPRSRFVVARALLVDGEIQRALSWMPEQVTASDPTLRMLRARAQHAGGRLDAAVTTLSSNVPPVSEQPEYRVTLATLLQQQGQGQEAAAHWAELIAWDDSRAPWWVGLAIALEDQGEIRGATRAYEQAAALPGLPPSLADYVQRRLQSLRAG